MGDAQFMGDADQFPGRLLLQQRRAESDQHFKAELAGIGEQQDGLHVQIDILAAELTQGVADSAGLPHLVRVAGLDQADARSGFGGQDLPEAMALEDGGPCGSRPQPLTGDHNVVVAQQPLELPLNGGTHAALELVQQQPVLIGIRLLAPHHLQARVIAATGEDGRQARLRGPVTAHPRAGAGMVLHGLAGRLEQLGDLPVGQEGPLAFQQPQGHDGE